MSADIEALLNRLLPQQQRRRGNVIFAFDATASRENTWDMAMTLTTQMFQEITTIGTLSMQVGYFRGVQSCGGECKFSSWVEDPMALATTVSKVKCQTGETQIQRVLEHVAKESSQRKINALIYVGDCFEEERDVIAESTAKLARADVPAFMFHEGYDIVARRQFEEIARITKGKCFKFDKSCLEQLAETLSAIATFAVGGIEALPPAARNLIGRI